MESDENLNSFLAVDFEFNQYFDFGSTRPVPKEVLRCPCEIIQIGAVDLDANLNPQKTMDVLVRPQIFKRIHPHVERLTKLNTKKLQKCPLLKEIFGEFEDLATGKVFLIWGPDDIAELYRNVLYFDIYSGKLPLVYINVQKITNEFIAESTPNTQMSLRNAVQHFGIDTEKHKFHDALGDALYTAAIFKKICETRGITQDDLQYVNILRIRLAADVKMNNVSAKQLFSATKELLGRNLTEDEQTVALYAYTAGTRRRFEKAKKHKE